MNEKEVCFIICSNHQMYTEECLYYIRHLNIPAGFSIDILTVENAKSMAAGYNEAMQHSKAKYKVYLHQDTFIVNPDFIRDFLDVFQKDAQIGMIGMIGAPKLPESGIMWEGERCGAIYSWRIYEMALMQLGNSALTEVEVIDGLLMITQYDIPWREDLFDKWDFYDCSQSKEFERHGYKIVVPAMSKPWCLHDTGFINQGNYETERLKFLKEYKKQTREIYMERQKIQEQQMENTNYKATIILTTYNRLKELMDTLKWLENMEGIANILIVDNGSQDATAQWLASQQYEYIYFDEGIQGYGKLWNTVLKNFETAEYVIFMEAGVYPEKTAFIRMMEVLQSKCAGAVSPVKNQKQPDKNQCPRVLDINWRMWAVSKDIFSEVGYFQEEIKNPENVLVDYALKMIKHGHCPAACYLSCTYEEHRSVAEIYEEADSWRIKDREILKNVWGQNYFNVIPNLNLIGFIEEEKEKEFSVLEVGCDLGATLVEIKNQFPNCKTYGVEINEAAVEVAKHINDVRYGNIDELKMPFTEKFDYIIFGDVLEHLRHPEEVVRMCRDFLNENGYIIASIPNIMHISVLEKLIDGMFTYEDTGLLDRTHIHFFTYYEIGRLFVQAGYEIRGMGNVAFPISDRQRAIEDVLLPLSGNTEQWMYETFQYVVKAQRVDA